MMESKALANHVTLNPDLCFHCGGKLDGTQRFVKLCAQCGAVNLDIYSTE